jgi:hypothetical protein
MWQAARKQVEKRIQLRSGIDSGDFKVKLNTIRKVIEAGELQLFFFSLSLSHLPLYVCRFSRHVTCCCAVCR